MRGTLNNTKRIQLNYSKLFANCPLLFSSLFVFVFHVILHVLVVVKNCINILVLEGRPCTISNPEV